MREHASLSYHFDAVLMLTWSDWKTEPRSNRYHFASRFAKHVPVLFVQPDREKPVCTVEETEIAGVEIVHLYERYGARQEELLTRLLSRRGVKQPMAWVYNPWFVNYVSLLDSPLRVYHATEDYLDPEVAGHPLVVSAVRDLLAEIDMVVAVSDGVRDSCRSSGRYRGAMIVLENACDYSFWAEGRNPTTASGSSARPVALYQGGINHRLDWKLLHAIASRLSGWDFWLCGSARGGERELRVLQRLPNVKYWGQLSTVGVRDLAGQATVGIIPFVQKDYISISMPLKAFEYVAGDLPVVSVPIDALKKHPQLFFLASDADRWVTSLEAAAGLRDSAAASEVRKRIASARDYDVTHPRLVEALIGRVSSTAEGMHRANILVVYDIDSTHVNTIAEHLRSFHQFSRHSVHFATCTGQAKCRWDLDAFDAVVLHYSVRLSLTNHLSTSFASAIETYCGLKIAFIQDEYNTAETTRKSLERLGVHVVYTCVPERYRSVVYPDERFRAVEFVETLTGYTSSGEARDVRPAAERSVVIGYRGRRPPFWYGDLGQEKEYIGRAVREVCERKSIPCDIEWDDSKRIYGDGWPKFLENCRATLGTESGSNIFDEVGDVKARVEAALKDNPTLTYQEAKSQLLAGLEGRIQMNQISPKLFEAISSRTALVLFDGDYSGVVQPDTHYIPLRKDISNINEVLDKLADASFVDHLTARAYRDIIESGKYSYEAFVRNFDDHVSSRLRKRTRVSETIGVLCAARRRGQWHTIRFGRGWTIDSQVTSVPLVREGMPRHKSFGREVISRCLIGMRFAWRLLPRKMRRAISQVRQRVARLLGGIR